MESSIAKFLWRQPACERLPTQNHYTIREVCELRIVDCCIAGALRASPDNAGTTKHKFSHILCVVRPRNQYGKLTWLVLGGDPAARSHRVEQLTAL